MNDNLPPHNEVIEKQVIGCCMLEPERCIDTCLVSLSGGSQVFYDMRNRVPYETMVNMHTSGEIVVSDSLLSKLQRTNCLGKTWPWAELSALCDKANPAALPYYIEELNAAWAKRKASAIMAEAASKLSDSQDPSAVFSKAQAQMADLADTKRRSAKIGSKSACEMMLGDLERRFNLQGKLSGLATGWSQYDHMTDGIQFGEQTIIAGRPSGGKSALGVCLLNKVCLNDEVPTMFVTLEMSVEALMRRLLSCNQSIPMSALRSGAMLDADMRKAAAFNKVASERPLYFLDCIGGGSIDMICAAIKTAVRRHNVRLVVIDYLQKIKNTTRYEKRTYEVGEVSGQLKACAVDTGAAFVTLAQLSREPDKDKGRVPRLSDLADSAQIERDADTVVLLHRPKTDDDPHGQNAIILIGKQRDGETGLLKLHFDGRYCMFQNPP
jgi:replicative DNA helicase